MTSPAKKKGLRGRPGPAVHDDRVKRKFTTDTAKTLWLNNITEYRTDEGKLCLCAIKVAIGVIAYADQKRQQAIEHITALLEELDLDKLEAERGELGGCRDAIDMGYSLHRA